MAHAHSLMRAQLSARGRRLVARQARVLEDAVEAHRNPLYIELAVGAACLWSSHTEPGDLLLGTSIKDLLHKRMLAPLERCHGDEPVGRLLTYLSLLEEGISDTEMKDVLSLEEGFLLPVYLHSDPVVRRAPAYIWVDVMTFLQGCLLKVTSLSGLVLRRWRHQVGVFCRFETHSG